MKILFRVITLAVGVFTGVVAWGQSASTVDMPRLLNAGQDSRNWLIPGHDYGNQRNTIRRPP